MKFCAALLPAAFCQHIPHKTRWIINSNSKIFNPFLFSKLTKQQSWAPLLGIAGSCECPLWSVATQQSLFTAPTSPLSTGKQVTHLPAFLKSSQKKVQGNLPSQQEQELVMMSEICPSLPSMNPKVTQQTVPRKAALPASGKGTILVQPRLSQETFCGFQHQVP